MIHILFCNIEKDKLLLFNMPDVTSLSLSFKQFNKTSELKDGKNVNLGQLKDNNMVVGFVDSRCC